MKAVTSAARRFGVHPIRTLTPGSETCSSSVGSFLGGRCWLDVGARSVGGVEGLHHRGGDAATGWDCDVGRRGPCADFCVA